MADDFEVVSLLVDAGKAKPGGSINPTLGPLGVNIPNVLAEINAQTAHFEGMQVPVEVKVNKANRKFTISVGLPPTSALIKNELGLAKGSGKSGSEVLANGTIDQFIKVAYSKRTDLLAASLAAATKEVLGTAVCMGITIEGQDPREIQKRIDAGDFESNFASFLKENPF
ncbi:MAG: 50S ribosomal protein L11 [Candidatus Heimdallarchaeota archaeon]|nr:50S ribosomal protein L11 [Candidatus Heimdallarchaeota archaeon]